MEGGGVSRKVSSACAVATLWRPMIYALVRAAVMLCALSQPAAAFQAGLVSGRPVIAQRTSTVQLAVETSEDCGCAEPELSSGVLMNDVLITGRTLRDTVLADVNGGRTALKDVIGDEGKAVVVFLRHLG